MIPKRYFIRHKTSNLFAVSKTTPRKATCWYKQHATNSRWKLGVSGTLIGPQRRLEHQSTRLSLDSSRDQFACLPGVIWKDGVWRDPIHASKRVSDYNQTGDERELTYTKVGEGWETSLTDELWSKSTIRQLWLDLWCFDRGAEHNKHNFTHAIPIPRSNHNRKFRAQATSELLGAKVNFLGSSCTPGEESC